ncbi:hypothetical protein Bhyg_12020 [Pseudolycoriella hygida]|uniref:Regulatory protein zeste n=1 Tax=Pseudolycoriella hygida TaxID=35572 RepID=A0A9Q0MWG9_9DIPT|nr:hypothetical protein Bhyg_12020 [Pseudolycoriella hygida]
MTPISSTTGIARDLNPVASTASTSVSIMQNVSPVLIASEVYAPTEQAPDDVKDAFYEQLAQTLNNVKKSDMLVLLGDLNAQVGSLNVNWESVMGTHGLGTMNDNEMCIFRREPPFEDNLTALSSSSEQFTKGFIQNRNDGPTSTITSSMKQENQLRIIHTSLVNQIVLGEADNMELTPTQVSSEGEEAGTSTSFGGGLSSVSGTPSKHIRTPMLTENQPLTVKKNRISRFQQDKRSYTNPEQQKRLLILVQQNYSALYGRIANRLHADVLKSKIWKLITDQLNELGPPKTAESWKLCLAALKDKAKKKLTTTRQRKNRNMSQNDVELNDLDNKIVKIFNIETSTSLHELGFCDIIVIIVF